jgi:hypothetical protein
MASIFRVHGWFSSSMIHDFPDAVGFFFRRRRPPPWGWCGLSFFFVEPHGLPLFFADPLDITIDERTGKTSRSGQADGIMV